ncbi:MAG: hypothetical protein ABJB69_08030 [Spartobacteria bacterium]
MRIVLAICALICVGANALAQDQEDKLVDRLLKPSTSLQNSSQNKTFAPGRTSATKQARVGVFYVAEKPKAKSFSGNREFSASEFTTQSLSGAKNKARVSSAQSDRAYPTWRANAAGSSPTTSKSASTGKFSGNRPFLDKGKSQKFLDRQNPPMTIDQVRELLNKNK